MISDTGTLTFTDIDQNDTSNTTRIDKEGVSVTAYRADGTTEFTLTADQIDNINNAFGINPTTSSNNSGSIDWTYAIDGSNISFLEEDERIEAIFTVWVEDQHGERATKDVTVTISGVANNAPIIALESNNSNSGSIDETDSGLTTSGTLTVRDADTLDEVTATLVDTITITGTSDLSAAPNEQVSSQC